MPGVAGAEKKAWVREAEREREVVTARRRDSDGHVWCSIHAPSQGRGGSVERRSGQQGDIWP